MGMVEENDSTTAQALENLQQIKQGDDPREERTKVEKVQAELNRLFREHDMPGDLTRDCVHAYVADWKRRIGNCKYNTYIPSKEFGQRVTERESRHGEYAIGIAVRAFDSKDTWKDTVAHELAHVTAFIENGHSSPGHGTIWKMEAERLGADPTRTDRVSDENQVEPNYIIECVECGHTWERQKRSKIVKQPDRYNCGNCEGDLKSYEV